MLDEKLAHICYIFKKHRIGLLQNLDPDMNPLRYVISAKY
jgi:hypothetical protein